MCCRCSGAPTARAAGSPGPAAAHRAVPNGGFTSTQTLPADLTNFSSLAFTRVMSSLLYDVQPTDPQTFVVVTAAFAAIALVACCVPALKAAHVDSAIALRYE